MNESFDATSYLCYFYWTKEIVYCLMNCWHDFMCNSIVSKHELGGIHVWSNISCNQLVINVQDCTTSTTCLRLWTAKTGKVCSDYTTKALWLVLACLITATKQTETTLRGSKSPPPSHWRFVSGYLALYKFGLTFVSLTLYTTSIQPSFPLSWCCIETQSHPYNYESIFG